VGRDPKIVWYEPGKKWVMIVYEEGGGNRGYDLYDSADMKKWRWLQHLPEWYECPEFFQLPVVGDSHQELRWVVYGSIYETMRSAFQLGKFDGEKFVPESIPQVGHAGPNFYAAQIFSHAPDGRKIMVGWLEGAAYCDMPFGHGMSLPLELSLRQAGEEIRLCYYPLRELEELRVATDTANDLSVASANALLANLEEELLDLEFELTPLDLNPITFDIGGYPVIYYPQNGVVTFAGRSVNRKPDAGALHLRFIIDRSVTEVFVDYGWGAFSAMTLFTNFYCRCSLEGNAIVNSLQIHVLRSIWKKT
jgi:sucrose-6-phosphate hydrolase SacC (GH32 family)